MSAGGMAVLAAALELGCLRPGPWALAAVGGMGLLLAGLVGARHGGRRRARLAVVALALSALGSGFAGAQLRLLEEGPLAALAREGGTAQLVGTVVTDVRRSPHGGWSLVRVTDVDGRRTRSRAMLRLAAAAARDGNGDPAAPAPPLGARVAFTASARPLGDAGFERHLRRLHAGTALRPVGEVRVVAAPPGWLAATTRIRDRVRRAASARLPHDHAVLLSGLVTGDTSGQREHREAQFEATGLTHLVAVSGSNVALVVAAALGSAGAVGAGLRAGSAWAAAAVMWFAVLVRFEPSVLRASVMALLVLAGRVVGRRADPRHALATTVIVLLLIDPLLAAQLGFVLSVLATAGVLVLAPLLHQRLRGPAWLRALMAASVGAQAAVAPVLLGLDGVPLAALPANVVAVPAAGVASAVGVATALLAQLSIEAAGWLAFLALPALSVVLRVAEKLAGGPVLQAGTVLSGLGLPAVLVALAVAVAWRGRRRRPAGAVTGTALAVLLAVVLWPAPRGDVTGLTLTAFDVGQGEALLVEVPAMDPAQQPARMLVDAGPDGRSATAALRRHRVRRLDVVAVSHGHADHTGGLAAVLEGTAVGALVLGPGGAHDPAPWARQARAVAGSRGVAVVEVAAGQRFALGRATVEVLSPPAGTFPPGDLNPGDLNPGDLNPGDLNPGDLSPGDLNDHSLVLRVADAGGSALLTGDAEVAAQQLLLGQPGRLRSDILKVPHHGAATNADGFLAAVEAQVAVISVGAGNDYGHPHPRTLSELAGTETRRTDLEGDVRVEAGRPAPSGLGPASGRLPAAPSGHGHAGRHHTTTARADHDRSEQDPGLAGRRRRRDRLPGRARCRGPDGNGG